MSILQQQFSSEIDARDDFLDYDCIQKSLEAFSVKNPEERLKLESVLDLFR